MVELQAVGEQHIHLPTAQGAEEGRGIAVADQHQAPIGGGGAPVVGEGNQAQLLAAKEGQPVGSGADEALGQGLVSKRAVGGGRDRGEHDRAEQPRQGGEGPFEGQLKGVGVAGPQAADAVAELIAEGADLQEALEGKHHRRRVEGGAVVEAHAPAQGDAGAQTIGAELGQAGGQAGLDASIGGDGVEGIAEGAEQLLLADAGGLGWIEGDDAALGGHDQRARRPAGLTGAEGQGQRDDRAKDERAWAHRPGETGGRGGGHTGGEGPPIQRDSGHPPRTAPRAEGISRPGGGGDRPRAPRR